MGTLKDELLRAGLVDEKRARRAEHEQRTKRKRQGREQEQREHQASKDEASRQRQAQREADRQREQARRAQAEVREREQQERARRTSAIEQAYRDGELRRWDGPRRYYYVNGRLVESLNVSDDTARKLEQGQAAIVVPATGSGSPTILNAAAARHLREVAPERVLTFHAE